EPDGGAMKTEKQRSLPIGGRRADRGSEQRPLDSPRAPQKPPPATTVMLQLLNRIKDKRALPLLMARFNSTPNKQELIQTLALIGDEQTAKFLVEKYPVLQNVEKGEVLRLLVKFDLPAFRQLATQALLSGDATLVNYAVQGLQEDGSGEGVKIMIDAFENSPNSFTWSYLSNALAAAGTPAARAALLKVRDSGNPEKRTFAINGLRMLQQRSQGYQHIYQEQQLNQAVKYKEAVEQYDLAIQLDPNLSDAYAGRGHALLHLDKPPDAGKDFAKALEQDPYNSLALTGLCLVM